MIEIQANEIRIGNWVQCVGIYKDSILRAGMVQVDAEFLLLVENKKILAIPVSLNPEILLACGFKQSHPTSKVNKLTIAYEDENYPCTLQTTEGGLQICRSGIGAIMAPVKYLHQLQNLYFALTGEELEVNLIAKTVPV